MKVTVLAENSGSGRSELIHEHGLSLYIEYGDQRFLIDAGASDAYAKNAAALGIDLEHVDICVLSHGHYDHANGLPDFLNRNTSAPLYMMKTAAEGHYKQSDDGNQHYIGIPEELGLKNNRIRLVDKVCSIAEGVYLVPHTTPGLGSIGEHVHMYTKHGEDYVPDDFSHEMSIVFSCEDGLVIVSSCSHAGIDNIIREVDETFRHAKIHSFIGGLHMMGMQNDQEICTWPEQKIQRLAFEIKDYDIREIWTGHCTGEIGFRLLSKYLEPDQVRHLTTGEIFSFN